MITVHVIFFSKIKDLKVKSFKNVEDFLKERT
jgi:hypothetical protein